MDTNESVVEDIVMRLLVDLGTFEAKHQGGKDEVAYNLLRGFSKLGLTESILCVCRQELVDIVRTIDPDYHVLALERPRHKIKLDVPITHFKLAQYGKALKKTVAEYHCDCVLFTNKGAPPIHMNVPTVMLPHDVKPAIRTLRDHAFTLGEIYQTVGLWANFKQMDIIIAISDFDKAEMTRCFPKYAHKVTRIYNPIRFKEVQKEGPGEVITAINLQWDHKNIITLVRAYALIANQIDERLFLVGRRSSFRRVEREIDKTIHANGLDERVVFTGFVDDEDLERIIARTRLYVNPSLFEGFGMTAIEMMGCGVPTIVNAETASPETTMGLCSYYEPGTDAQALANAMLAELRNPTSPQRLNQIARKVREQYDYVAVAKEYWDYLNSLVASEKGAKKR